MPTFNRLAHVRIGPFVRRVRNPRIRNAHIYPCDSAGYQNELLRTNSRTGYTHRLDDVWVGYNALCFVDIEYMQYVTQINIPFTSMGFFRRNLT